MIEDNNQPENDDNGDQNRLISSQKLKDYGKQAYIPFFNVMTKYQDEFIPYLRALSKGLEGGGATLRGENGTEVERYVSGFFEEAAHGVRTACEKLETKDINAISSFVSDLGIRKPGILFGTSYIAGLFFGRLGRHIANTRKQGPVTAEPPAFDQTIH